MRLRDVRLPVEVRAPLPILHLTNDDERLLVVALGRLQLPSLLRRPARRVLLAATLCEAFHA